MTVENLKNIAASVRQRLLNKAREDKRSFEEIVRLYAMERFLYRLSRSAFKRKLILKGALMLRVWKETIHRPTMDIDALGRMGNDAATLENCIRKICCQPVESDGINFDAASVRSDQITSDAEYVGCRLRFLGHLGTMRIPMQIDIGFGDTVYPEPREATMPSILGFPAPAIIGYSKESAVAEKFHAMVQKGELNSRMKDFFDIWLLSTTLDFDGETLAKAIEFTFGKRDSPIHENIVAFGEAFSKDKQVQWKAFLKRLDASGAPESLSNATRQIATFLLPIVRSIVSRSSAPAKWTAPGPWGNP